MIDYPYAHHHPERCRATVYHRDTWRRTGRTKSGFEMHYTRAQCARKAGAGGYCYQHDPATEEQRRVAALSQMRKKITARIFAARGMK